MKDRFSKLSVVYVDLPIDNVSEGSCEQVPAGSGADRVAHCFRVLQSKMRARCAHLCLSDQRERLGA